MSQPVHLLVLPAYNEEGALARTLTGLDGLPPHFEVLVVNDGSADRTSEIAHAQSQIHDRKISVVDLPLNSGIGVAVQTGYLFAAQQQRYQYVIQFDADGQHDAGAILRLVAAADELNLDCCIGSRFLEPGKDGFRSTFARRLGIRFLAALISYLSGQKITDPTSGFRCAGPRAWQSFARRYPDDYPEPESLFWCFRNRLRVGEIPVTMHARQDGVSSIRRLKSVYYMVKVTLAILVDRIRAMEHKGT